MNGLSTALECRDNILGGRLEQGNDICDDLVLALECGQIVKLIGAHIEALFCIGGLERGDTVLAGLLDELGGDIGSVAEHQCRSALQARVKLGVVDIACLKCFLEK